MNHARSFPAYVGYSTLPMAVARQFPSLKLFFAERMSDEDTYIYIYMYQKKKKIELETPNKSWKCERALYSWASFVVVTVSRLVVKSKGYVGMPIIRFEICRACMQTI